MPAQPHTRITKEAVCGCAGIYTAHAAMEFYAEAFEQAGALDKLEGIASFHGADFYELPRNRGKLTLINRPQFIPVAFIFVYLVGVPLRAGVRLYCTAATRPGDV